MSGWIDAHIHSFGDADSLAELDAIEKRFGYTEANFLSVEGMDDAAQNALAIAWKLSGTGHYAFGGLHHRFSYDSAEEAQRLYDIGFDGIKMIENKPTERFRLGLAQDAPFFSGMYRTAEKLGMPLLVHINDPRVFWDEEQIPAWAKDAGYYCGGPGRASFEQILKESLHVLECYPKLQICFAHFLFLSDDHDLLRILMDTYPNLWLDVTAGTEMYPNFASNPELWRQFFEDYQDRILYGTDNVTPMNDEDERIAEVLNNLERKFFTSSEAIPLWDQTLCGLGAPEPVTRKLTEQNFRRFAGETPRKIDRNQAKAYLKERLDNPGYCLSGRERKIIADVIEIMLV